MFPANLVSQIPTTTGVALPVAPVVIPVQIIATVGASSETNNGANNHDTQQPGSHSDSNGGAEFANVLANATNTQVQYSVDKDTGIVAFQVIDEKTHKVIRQVPSKEVIAMAQQLKQTGVLLDQKA